MKALASFSVSATGSHHGFWEHCTRKPLHVVEIVGVAMPLEAPSRMLVFVVAFDKHGHPHEHAVELRHAELGDFIQAVIDADHARVNAFGPPATPPSAHMKSTAVALAKCIFSDVRLAD
jgi:hypothetical protein